MSAIADARSRPRRKGAIPLMPNIGNRVPLGNTVVIDTKLKNKIKKIAKEERRTIRQVVENAIRNFIYDKEQL